MDNILRRIVGMSVRYFRLRSSKIDVSTFEDRCVDFRRSMIVVSTFEDRCVVKLNIMYSLCIKKRENIT